MNIVRLAFSGFIILITLFSYASEPKQGFWQGILNLDKDVNLPFVFSIDNKQSLTVYNAQEEIILDKPSHSDDSLRYSFLAFKTYVIFKPINKNSLKGYYVYPDRKNNARIPFEASYLGNKKPSCSKKTVTDISGRWKTIFNVNKENPYPAIGKFKQENNGRVTGTFLTETGDYRFLDGYLTNDQLTLSCFDGSHAFLFKAKYTNGKLKGTFYSGSHWKTKWEAEPNNSFELKDPDSLTRMIKDDFTFVHPDLNKNEVLFPNESTQGKVIIIQILGTWCPNCLDETNFYKELYQKYHREGLEIIGVAYEYPSTFQEQAERVERYIKNKNVPYTILIGGHASKKEASTDFSMLNEITSFPTSVFINRSGEVVKIHTGFNGPGTGEVYDEYVEDTHQLIQKLINE